LTGFKRENLATVDDDLVAGLRVSSFAGAFRIDDKIAKTGDLHFLALFQAAFDDIEGRFDYIGGVLL
jgi:hypothetical protein